MRDGGKFITEKENRNGRAVYVRAGIEIGQLSV